MRTCKTEPHAVSSPTLCCPDLRNNSIIEKGGSYSYIRVLHNYFLLNSIVFMVCENDYMNMEHPSPCNYQAGYAN